VISNLLSNAFRWTPDGGRIDLELQAANGAVKVEVVDSGPGIPPEHKERIFQAFISHDVDGTGLGLPIARELAFALGGRIELESQPGSGSRFRLVLPVALSQASARAPARGASVAGARGGGGSVGAARR
jgi:signal transduction histidine kinase